MNTIPFPFQINHPPQTLVDVGNNSTYWDQTSSFSCASSHSRVARSLRARHGCQAGEKINVAWPTFVAEEFEKKNSKRKRTKVKKERQKEPIQEFECALHEESDFSNRQKIQEP
jgi:hypothetical protein